MLDRGRVMSGRSAFDQKAKAASRDQRALADLADFQPTFIDQLVKVGPPDAAHLARLADRIGQRGEGVGGRGGLDHTVSLCLSIMVEHEQGRTSPIRSAKNGTKHYAWSAVFLGRPRLPGKPGKSASSASWWLI